MNFLLLLISLSNFASADYVTKTNQLFVNFIKAKGVEETNKKGVKTILMTKKTSFGSTMFSFSTDKSCSVIMKTTILNAAVGKLTSDEMGNLHCKLRTNGIDGRLKFSNVDWNKWKKRTFKWTLREFKACNRTFSSGECTIRK